MIVRASDVPTYVQYGAADLGVAGKDVLLEHGGAGLYQPLDLGIARCRMSVATKRGYDWAGTVQRGARIRVATKYVEIAREHFAAKGMHVDLIKLYGSMELAPLVRPRRRDRRPRVDRQHAQGERSRRRSRTIMPITARLVVNPAALKLKRDTVKPLVDALAAACSAKGSRMNAHRVSARCRPQRPASTPSSRR